MKTRNEFKRILIVAALTFLGATSNSLAVEREGRGGIGTGGGDPCEDRIQEIRDDLKTWMTDGGPAKGLVLPSGVTPQDYTKRMLEQMDSAFVKCVKPGDKDHPVTVDGEPKVCKFKSGLFTKKAIVCDYDAFLNKTNQVGQYKLVHHEYAGAAGLEIPNGPVSEYKITKQLHKFLKIVSVVKLSIEPNIPDATDLKGLFEGAKEEFSLDEVPPYYRDRMGVLSEGIHSYKYLKRGAGYDVCAVQRVADGAVKLSDDLLFTVIHESKKGPKIKAKTSWVINPFGTGKRDNNGGFFYGRDENFRDDENRLNAWVPGYYWDMRAGTTEADTGAQTIYRINGPFLVFYSWEAKIKNADPSERQNEVFGYCYSEEE